MASTSRSPWCRGNSPSTPPPAEAGPRTLAALYASGLRLLAGPVLFAAVLAAPLPGLSREAHALAAVFAWTVAYWVTQALPLAVTALLGSVLAIVLGVAPVTTVLAPYADPIIFLFIGSFILAQAMRDTGLDRRFAFALLSRGWATRTPARLLATTGVVTCALSLWVSNTATTAMMLPIGVGILAGVAPGAPGAGAHRPSGPFAHGLLLMLTWSSSVAVGVPVGSPPNLIAIGMIRNLTDRRVSFFDWMAVAMPLTVVMLAACWVILTVRYARAGRASPAPPFATAAATLRLGPWSRGEVNVALAFTTACLLWTLPGAVAMASSPEAPLPRFFERHLPESVVALGAAVLLFLLPTHFRAGEFTVTWRQAARIDWGTILLFGGGLSLGRLTFETKLADAMGVLVLRASGAESLWALTAVAIGLGILLSETSSNTASASVLIPVVIAVAQGLGVSPIPPALGAALGASFGFMLPVSTPPNAIVYGSGLVPLREMITAGLVLDVVGAGLIWIGLRVLCPLFGVI